MKKSFQIGSAFVGLIAGAGFASGQEVMQYFTSFGIWGTVGGILATLLFIFLGYTFAHGYPHHFDSITKYEKDY
ncbi:hypothetical protein JYK21_05440 [Ralstonia pickettii]|nr:hypothetical protein [Ralstonia pickettii]